MRGRGVFRCFQPFKVVWEYKRDRLLVGWLLRPELLAQISGKLRVFVLTFRGVSVQRCRGELIVVDVKHKIAAPVVLPARLISAIDPTHVELAVEALFFTGARWVKCWQAVGWLLRFDKTP